MFTIKTNQTIHIVHARCLVHLKKKLCSWKRNNNKQAKASEQTLEELLPNAKLVHEWDSALLPLIFMSLQPHI